jgi:serine/threonine-protein kinase
MSNDLPEAGDLVDGRYRLVDQIGSGGHGVVFRARREGIGRAIALKIISPEGARGNDLDRLRREVFHASGLTHPNTIEVHDYGTTADGDLYVAMEYLPGLDLCDWLAEFGAMDVPQTIDAILQVLDSLAEAHRLGIVHRDLKPENIIVQRPPGPGSELQLKLLDFGLSKYVGDESSSVPATRLTQDGRVYGTPQYMAPEQACGDTVTPKTDIYTVGLITYEMLSGEPAFAGESRQSIMRRQIVDDLPGLPAIAKGTALEGFVDKCTEKDPENRFENAGRARQWLSSQKEQYDELRDLFGLSIDGDTPEEAADEERSTSDTMPPVDEEGQLSATRISERIADLPLIGRDDERQIAHTWADGLDERPGWLWMSGAPGTGKSRLLTELRADFDGWEMRMLSARFRRDGSTVGTLAELLGPVLGRPVGELPSRIEASTIERMRHELGFGRDDGKETTNTGPMFPATRDFLLSLARSQTTVLMFDDLHLAGGRAAGFLQRIFAQASQRGSSLGLIVAGRSQELRANPPVAQLMDRLLPDDDQKNGGAPGIRRLGLGALDDVVAERFLDHVLPLEPPLRESVVRHASGNPLYLAQLVRYLTERDLLVEGDDQKVGLAEHDIGLDQLVPPSLRGLCLRRLRSLARDSQAGRAPIQLLARMAILGDRFEASLLERMLEAEADPATDALAAAIETLTDLDIVRRIELGGEPGFAFSDPVFRKAVLQSLDRGSDRARKLHMLAARTKVRHLGADRKRRLPDRAHEVAQHLQRAGEDERAVDWYLRSASHFESVGDLSMALDDLRSADRLVTNTDEPSAETERRRIDIRMQVADIARRDGRFGPAEDTLRELLSEIGPDDAPMLEAEIARRLGEVQLHQAHFEEARDAFQKARNLFGRQDDEMSALRAAIGHANSFRYQGKNAEADQRFRMLLDRAQSLGVPSLEARCRLALGRSTYANGALKEAREHFEAVFELVDEESEVYGEALIDCGLVELFREGTSVAVDRLREAVDHARKRGDLLSRARARLTLGMALRRTTALVEAGSHAEKAHALYERSAHRWGIAKAVLLQGEIAWSRGQPGRGAQLAGDARKLHRDLEDYHGLALSLTYEALFLNTTGHAEEARDLLMRALALESRSELELYRSRALLFMGMVEETENDLERAEMYYDDALEIASRQEHLEVELLAEISLIKIELVTGPGTTIEKRVGSIRRRARSCGFLYAELFALTVEALFDARAGNEQRLDESLSRLQTGMNDGDGPDLRIPQRLFRLAQMMARHRETEDTDEDLEAAERVMRRLGAEEYAHRLSLQRRTISDGSAP